MSSNTMFIKERHPKITKAKPHGEITMETTLCMADYENEWGLVIDEIKWKIIKVSR